MFINYGRDINKVDFQESYKLLNLLTKHLFNEELDKVGTITILETAFYEADRDCDAYKKKYKVFYNADEDKLYNVIKDNCLINKSDTILFIKSTICRLYDWFLLSDKELSNKKDIPPVIDTKHQLFQIYDDSYDILSQSHNNQKYIEEFLGHPITIDLKSLLSKTDKHFAQILSRHISRFKDLINKEMSKGYLFKRITNKSASFYNIGIEGINTYIENLFRYESDLKYMDYANDNLDRINIKGYFDYIKCNIIKNKGRGTRFIFFSNSQVNSFLKVINDCFEKSFRSCKYLGVYNQDKAIEDIITIFNQNKNRSMSVLSLDVSKYSDTLPKGILYRVCNLLTGDESLSKAIVEAIGLPIEFNGKLYEHNASLQGMYFDFSLITIVNLYIQIAITIACEERFIHSSVVGDDACTILTGDKHIQFAEIGREVWALTGNKVNLNKMVACNTKEGELTFLKYLSEIKDGNLVNLSGLSPGLLFKNIISYNRIGSIVAYLKKSQYLEKRCIPRELIKEFCDLFRDSIDSAYNHIRVSPEDREFLYQHAYDKLLERPFMFGGLKEYNTGSRKGRIELVNDVQKLKDYWDFVFYGEDDNSFEIVQAIIEHENLNNHPLSDDISIFLSEEYKDIYIKFSRFLERSDNFIEKGIGDIIDIRKCIKTIGDRKFDKYKPSGLTTDRISDQKFEDKLLLSSYKEFDVMNLACLPGSNSFDEKQANTIILSALKEMKNNFLENRRIRFSYMDNTNVMIDMKGYKTISVIKDYNNQEYESLENALWRVRHNDKYKHLLIDVIISNIEERNKVKVYKWLNKNDNISTFMYSLRKYYDKKNYIEGVIKTTIDELINPMISKEKNKLIHDVQREVVTDILEW